MNDGVLFNSDDGPDDSRLEVSFGGNLDWYFTVYPSKEDARRHIPLAFRIATSGTQLPDEFGYVAALLYQVGQRNFKNALDLGKALLRTLEQRVADEEKGIQRP